MLLFRAAFLHTMSMVSSVSVAVARRRVPAPCTAVDAGGDGGRAPGRVAAHAQLGHPLRAAGNHGRGPTGKFVAQESGSALRCRGQGRSRGAGQHLVCRIAHGCLGTHVQAGLSEALANERGSRKFSEGLAAVHGLTVCGCCSAVSGGALAHGGRTVVHA